MINILMCVDSFEVGGVTEVVKTIYKKIDCSKYHIDFLSMRRLDSEFESEVVRANSKIFYIDLPALNGIPVLNYNIRILSVLNQMKRWNVTLHYDVAHIHAHADIYTVVAKKMKIPNIVIHAHEAIGELGGDKNKSILMRFVQNKRKHLYLKNARWLVGDSLKACKAKFGEPNISDSRIKVIYPPVDSDRFNVIRYSKSDAIIKYNIIEDKLNLIHVGRLSAVKNQFFLIDIIEALRNITDCHLYIVGEGELEVPLHEYINNKGLTDHITMLPADTPPLIYTAMDYSIFPSLSEAFGMVAVESQFMETPCFASTNVPSDVDLGFCYFLSLDKGPKYWAETIYSVSKTADNNPRSNLGKFTVSEFIKGIDEIYDDS